MWLGIPKELKKKSSMQCLCNKELQKKKEFSHEVYVSHANKYESLLQADSIIFNGFDQVCPKYPGRFAISV